MPPNDMPKFRTQREVVYFWCDHYHNSGLQWPGLKKVSAVTSISQSQISRYRAEWSAKLVIGANTNENLQDAKNTIAS